jgi:hypothetical protein
MPGALKGSRFIDPQGDEVIQGSSMGAGQSPQAQADYDALVQGYNRANAGASGAVQLAQAGPYAKVGFTAPPLTIGVAAPTNGKGDIYVYSGVGVRPGAGVSFTRDKGGVAGPQIGPTSVTEGYSLNDAVHNLKAKIYDALTAPINDAFSRSGFRPPYSYVDPPPVDGINKKP